MQGKRENGIKDEQIKAIAPANLHTRISRFDRWLSHGGHEAGGVACSGGRSGIRARVGPSLMLRGPERCRSAFEQRFRFLADSGP